MRGGSGEKGWAGSPPNVWPTGACEAQGSSDSRVQQSLGEAGRPLPQVTGTQPPQAEPTTTHDACLTRSLKAGGFRVGVTVNAVFNIQALSLSLACFFGPS